ncbi:MAG: rhomboid family intramembrane serine protease [Halioglobus sp.]
MSDTFLALEVNVAEDLLPMSALLHQRGIAHRIYEEKGQQVVMVAQADHVQQVQSLYRAWREGEVTITLKRTAKDSQSSVLYAAGLREFPITLVLLVLCIIGFALVYWRPLNTVAAWFTFLPLSGVTGTDLVADMQGQYWRWITPVFLHFDWLHIAFNALWLWELGRKVERVIGHFNMFMLFIAIALVSNTIQYAFGGEGIFGGMSGVVYGLLGFAWLAPLLQPRWLIQPSTPIMLFMVGWLVAGLAGVVEGVGLGSVANAAHVGGLVCGLCLGAVFGFLSRLRGDTDLPPPV